MHLSDIAISFCKTTLEMQTYCKITDRLIQIQITLLNEINWTLKGIAKFQKSTTQNHKDIASTMAIKAPKHVSYRHKTHYLSIK